MKHKVAGIVIYKYFGNIPKFLGLWTGDFYDLTKGHIEPGESAFQAAIRETFEESNIINIDINKDVTVYEDDGLVMFLGSTLDDPKIKPNPITGNKEHEFAKWLSYAEILQDIKPSLRPIILWAYEELIKNGLLICHDG